MKKIEESFVRDLIQRFYESQNNVYHIFSNYAFTGVVKRRSAYSGSKINFMMHNDKYYYFKHADFLHDNPTLKINDEEREGESLICFRMRDGLLYRFESWNSNFTWEDGIPMDTWGIHLEWYSICQKFALEVGQQTIAKVNNNLIPAKGSIL